MDAVIPSCIEVVARGVWHHPSRAALGRRGLVRAMVAQPTLTEYGRDSALFLLVPAAFRTARGLGMS